MFTSIKILKISQIVNAGNEEIDYYVPASGSNVDIRLFAGETSNTPNSAIKLLWKYNEADEEIIWIIKSSSKMPFTYSISGTNGTSKIAVSCENQESGDLFMASYAYLEEY